MVKYFRNKALLSGTICAILGVFVASSSPVLAQDQSTTTDEISQQEGRITQLEQDIATALQSINDNQASISVLQAEMDALNARQAEIQAEIVVQQEKVNQRVKVMEERLVAIQLSQRSSSSFLTILESENFADLVNRFFAFQQIFANDQQIIDDTNAAVEHLQALEQEVIDNQVALEEKQAAVVLQSETMNAEITSLKQTLSENQDIFAALQQRQKEEQEALALAELITSQNSAPAPAAIDSSAVIESVSATNTSVAEPESNSQSSSNAQEVSSLEHVDAAPAQPAEPTPAPTPQPTNGRQLTVRATAYSYNEPGLSFFTAMGYDLRQNPMMVAVDPTVIPLGSVVEVPGYGVAIAGDTGGAIKGNKIDLHYVDLQTAKNYGVQTVTITIY